MRVSVKKHVCSLHSNLLTLFCLEHEEPICSVCEGSSKQTHDCIPVDEAALDRKSQAQKTENQIQEDFEKLHQFLRYEEAARMAVLREEEEDEDD